MVCTLVAILHFDRCLRGGFVKTIIAAVVVSFRVLMVSIINWNIVVMTSYIAFKCEM